MDSQLDYVIAMNNAEATHRDVWEKKEMDKKNREFAELCGAFNPNGGEVCQICGMRNCVDGISDYAADPRLVLREMDKHPKGKLFYAWLMYQDNAEAIDDDGLIERDYMTDLTGKLCSRAIYFLKGVGR